MHSFQFSLSASRGSVFSPDSAPRHWESPPVSPALALVRAKHHNTRDNGGFMPFARNESGIAGQTEGQRERQRKDNVGERRTEQQIKICDILLIILIASLLWLPRLCSPLFLSIVIFRARPGITNSDVTRMQMWRQREHHQHCHNHGILSDNYEHQQYTWQ